MSGYVFSPRAQADLEAIWDYTVETWSIGQAERYVRHIQAACEALASGRRRGRSAEDIRSGYHKLAVGAHFIFYRTTQDGLVDIVRILHQSMDIPTKLTN